MMVLAKAFRVICILLDDAVYHCVDLFYQLFMMLAETGIFKSGDIRSFADRMYFFLGLIMIFKVSISIIQYIMNPDSVKDNKVGAPKLLKNVVIILIGIVLIPYVFEAAYSLQRIVLRDNVIGSLILGMKYNEGDKAKNYIDNAGNRMAFSTFTAFFHYDTNYINEECSNNPFNIDESGNAEISEACKSDSTQFLIIEEFMKSNAGRRYKEAYEEMDIHKLNNMDLYNYIIEFDEGDQLLFSYTYFVTTLAGGFLAYILLLFCFDIAVRSVKLGFLQLIAPIPLISKIDPKKGDEVFNKWVKECISTYLMLFIRLAAIYFAIFIISIIGDGMFNVVEPDKKWDNPFVFVFIIFGTLLFVKDLPKLIESITGMKLGGGGLSLKKKLGGVPLIGGAANKALGLAERTAARAGKGMLHAGRKALKQAGSRFAEESGLNDWRNDDKRLYNRIGKKLNPKLEKIQQKAVAIGKAVNDYTGDAMSDIGNDARNTFLGMGASVMDGLGLLESKKTQILNRQSSEKIELEQNKKLADSISAMETRAIERIKTGAAGELSQKYIKQLKQIEVLTNQGKADEAANAQFKLDQWMNSNEPNGATSQYIDGVIKGSYINEEGVTQTTSISDGTLQNGLYKNYIAQAEANGVADISTDGANIHGTLAGLKTRNNEIQRKQMDGNNEIAKIDEQIRAAKEFKSNK